MTKVCKKLNKCPKVKSLLDHDWAGDWQLAEAIVKACERCKGNEKAS